MFKIEKGPFAGTEIPQEQLMYVRDEANQIRMKPDGSALMYWPANHRTPVFLEKFPPHEGWSVTVSNSAGAFTLPDRFLGADGQIVQQPTVTFTACLRKDERVIAEASVLATIWGPKAWESGETIARGRLYDALGLSVPFASDPMPIPESNPSGAGASRAPSPTVGTAVAVPQPTESIPVAASATAEDLAAASPQPATETAATEAAESAAEPSIDPIASAPASPIDANLLRTIATQAAARGVSVPAFANVSDAKQFYKDLLNSKAPLRGVK